MGILFPARESLVSDIPARDGNLLNLFLPCSRWSLYVGEGLQAPSLLDGGVPVHLHGGRPARLLQVLETSPSENVSYEVARGPPRAVSSGS